MAESLNDLARKNSALLLVLLVCLVVAALNFQFLSSLQQLPACLYGCDLYNHLGSMYHIYYGGSIFENGQLKGELPWVPWLYHLYVVALSIITGLDPLFGTIYSSLPLIFITGLCTFFILKKVTSNRLLILAGLLVMLMGFPFFKYGNFAVEVIVPIMFLAWLYYLEKPDLKSSVFLALALAACNLTNVQLVFSQLILMGLIGLDFFLVQYNKEKALGGAPKNCGISSAIAALKKFGPLFAAASLISLLYWYGPFFIAHMQTPNNLQIYGWADFSKISEQISYPINTFVSSYLPGTPIMQALGLLEIFGMIAIFLRRNESRELRFFWLVLLAAFIALFHHLLTFNLLHMQFAPERMFLMLAVPLAPVMLVLSSEKIAKEINRKIKGVPNLFVPAAVLVLMIFAFAASFSNAQSSDFAKAALMPFPSIYTELRGWALNNSRVDDVFLATNEDAFMLNGLTGRKTISNRRTHTPVYTDMNQRMLDQAVILQGNDSALRTALLKKYGVKYVLWSAQWHSNEILLNSQGQADRIFDPLVVIQTPEYKKYLDENKVQYASTRGSLDPAPNPNYPRYNLYLVIPVQNFTKPWVQDLDRRLTPIKTIYYEGAEQFVIYGVKYD